MSDKIDVKTKFVSRDKQRQFIIIKSSTHKEDIVLINIHAPDSSNPNT